MATTDTVTVSTALFSLLVLAKQTRKTQSYTFFVLKVEVLGGYFDSENLKIHVRSRNKVFKGFAIAERVVIMFMCLQHLSAYMLLTDSGSLASLDTVLRS